VKTLLQDQVVKKPMSPVQWLQEGARDQAFGHSIVLNEGKTAKERLDLVNFAEHRKMLVSQGDTEGVAALDALAQKHYQKWLKENPPETRALSDAELRRRFVKHFGENGAAKPDDTDVYAKVEAALGTDVLSRLRKTTNPETFAATLRSFHQVLTDSAWLDDFNIILGSKTGAMSLLFSKALGVEDPASVVQEFNRAKELRALPETQLPNTPVGLDKKVDELAAESKAAQGGPADYSQPTAQTYNALTEDPVGLMRADLAAVLPGFLKDNFGEQITDVYRFVTENGVLRTAEEMGKGKGRDLLQLNTHAQFDLDRRLRLRIQKRVDGYMHATNGRPLLAKAYEARAARQEAEWLNAWDGMEAWLHNAGIKPHLDLVVDGKPVRHGLTLPQIYKQLAATGNETIGGKYGSQLMRMLFFGKGTGMAYTKLMDAVSLALAGKSEKVFEELTSKAKRNAIPGQDYRPMALAEDTDLKHNWLADKDSTKYFGYSAQASSKPLAFGGTWVKGPKQGFFKAYNSAQIARVLTDVLHEATEPLARTEAMHAEENVAKLTEQQTQITQEVLTHLRDLENDPEALVETVAHVGTEIKAAASTINAAPPAAAGAALDVQSVIPPMAKESAEAVSTGAKAALRGDKDAARAATDKVTASSVEHAEATFDATYDLAGKTTPKVRELMRLGDTAYTAVNITTNRFLDTLGTWFKGNYGMMMRAPDGSIIDAHRLFQDAGAQTQKWLADAADELNTLGARHGKQAVDRAFELWKRAGDDGFIKPDPATEAGHAFAVVENFMSRFIGGGKNSVLGHAFFNHEAGHAYVNKIFNRFKVVPGKDKDFFDLALAQEAAKKNGTNPLYELAAQFRHNAPAENSLQTMMKLAEASIFMEKNRAFMSALRIQGVKHGFYSKHPGEGLVRLVDTGDGLFADLIPHNAYVPREAAIMLNKVSEEMGKSSQIPGTFGHFVRTWLDPLLKAWKYGMTQINPGHHTRNMIGGISMTYFAEGTRGFKASYRDGLKLMSLRKEYTDLDTLTALKHLGEHKRVDSGEILASGKFGDIRYRDALNWLNEHGLLPRADVLNDVWTAGGEGAEKYTSMVEKLSLQTGLPKKITSTVSEAHEHFERIQHFTQILHKVQKSGVTHNGKKLNSLDEMVNYAAKRVRLFHPDVTNLTHVEKTYLRRVIPFYTWMRSAVVAIAESVVLHPARINAINKASYALAEANGVNPYSLADPFPQDQLFPSFLTEQMQGPQFMAKNMGVPSYFSMSPGIASWDVLNTWAGQNPVNGLLGSLNPALKLPLEMTTGTNLGTGVHINDMSDHLDSTLPVVNTLSNATGTSVTGSPVSLLMGKGLDPQYQVAAGNKKPSDQLLSILNKVSGIGLNSDTKPNYQHLADIEKRDRVAAANGMGKSPW
jgi:hypothetical protein